MSPEDVHKLAAGIVLVILAPLLGAEAGIVRGGWTRYIIPAGAFAMGAFLILDPIVFHGGDFGAEGLQHQLQGAVAVAIAIVELARARGRLAARGWGLALPLGLVALGIVFIAHSQHGTTSMQAQLALHRILGATIIMMAVVKAADVMGWAKGNWARVGWLLLGLSVSAQLFLYAEDHGARGAMPSDATPHAMPHGSH